MLELKNKLIALAKNKIQSDSHIFTKSLRQSALNIFEKKGFPTKKEEAWKYTSLDTGLTHDYQLAVDSEIEISEKEILKHFIDSTNYRLVFINGVFNPQLSITEEGYLVAISLKEALAKDIYQDDLKKYFTNVACKEETLTALNTVFVEQGSFVKIKKGKVIEKPLEILYLNTTQKPFFTQPRNLIIAEENTQVKIIEQHINISSQVVLTNVVTEIYTNKSAFVDYYKLQNDTQKSLLVDNTYSTQEDKSHSSVHTFSFGGDITRNNLNFYQEGEYMDSTLKGISILDDKQHIDHYTLVNHAQPNCESHQDYKTILLGASSQAFNGKIMVEKIAQKTNAYQQNDNIILSDKATVYTKPQLEIFADDVKCSHGCTIGQLDKDAVFYLQSRGIPKKEAKALLTYAFAHTVLSSVKIENLKIIVDKIIAQKLGVNKM